MPKVWYEKYPGIYRRTIDCLKACYPELVPSLENNKVYFRGPFLISDTYGEVDRFIIEVELPDRFPDDYPIVRETAQRIPRTMKRHTYKDGEACLGTPIDFWASLPADYTLADFLDGPVYQFFLGQALVEQGCPWPNGERGHGRAGLLEALAQLFGTSNQIAIWGYLTLLSRRNIDGHNPCPCGNKKPIRQCHRDQIHHLQSIMSPRRAKLIADDLRASRERRNAWGKQDGRRQLYNTK